MSSMETKSWLNPDDLQTPDKTHAASVKLGGVTLTKANVQPGWKWSTARRSSEPQRPLGCGLNSPPLGKESASQGISPAQCKKVSRLRASVSNTAKNPIMAKRPLIRSA